MGSASFPVHVSGGVSGSWLPLSFLRVARSGALAFALDFALVFAWPLVLFLLGLGLSPLASTKTTKGRLMGIQMRQDDVPFRGAVQVDYYVWCSN